MNKFGRLPRQFDARIPKVAALRFGLPAHPPAVNYSTGMPANLGMMDNDTLGDCTAAAVGHSIQVWTANNGVMVTPSDGQIEKLYSATSGYVPGQPNTDNGAVMQVVLKYWLGSTVDGYELAAFAEIDVADQENLKAGVFEAAVVYTGFNVPAYLEGLEAAGSVWDVDQSADNTIIGGHCVDVVGYDDAGNLAVISWGARYTMTPAFWKKFVDEAYVLINAAWVRATGKTPAGLTLAELESAMDELKEPLSGQKRTHHRHNKHRRRRAARAALAAKSKK